MVCGEGDENAEKRLRPTCRSHLQYTSDSTLRNRTSRKPAADTAKRSLDIQGSWWRTEAWLQIQMPAFLVAHIFTYSRTNAGENYTLLAIWEMRERTNGRKHPAGRLEIQGYRNEATIGWTWPHAPTHPFSADV